MSQPQRITPTEAKRTFTSLLNRIAKRKRPVVLQSRGKELAVIISMEAFDEYRKMRDVIGDHMDLAEALRVLDDPEQQNLIPWEELKRELKL
jgi:prevent-host-death family protein